MAPTVLSDGSWQTQNPNGSWGLPDYGITEGIANWLRPGTTDVKQAVVQNFSGTPYASNIQDTPNNYSTPNKSTGNNSTGDVLGRSTSNNNNNNNNNNGGGVNWGAGLTGEQVRALGMNPDAMVATNGKYYGSNGGGNGGGSGQDWDAIFNPAYESLKNYGNFLQQSKAEKLAGTEADYGRYTGQVTDEQKNLESSLAEQGRQLWESGRSAAGEALRAYNALAQQNASRYGLGTGAGSFISDLLGQEFMRAKASANETAQQGTNTLAIEGTKVKQFISGKMDELTKWKREADQSINDYFTKSMADIENQRGVLDQQKAAQKEAAVQNAINYKQQVEESDRTFKSQLATAAMQTIQNNTGKVYTPAEIAKVVNSFMQTGEFNPDAGNNNGQVANIGFNQNFTYDAQGRLIDKTTGLPVQQ